MDTGTPLDPGFCMDGEGGKPMASFVEALTALCSRRAVVFRSGNEFHYGPLGVALRRHFKDLWWQSCVTSQNCVFGVDVPVNFDIQPTHDKGLLYAFDHVRQTLNLDLPVGIAARTVFRTDADTDLPILGAIRNEELRMYQLVKCNDAVKWMDYWQSSRLRWWRELSTGPSQFNLRQVKNNQTDKTNHHQNDNNKASDNTVHSANNSGYTYSVEYAFPWGTDTVDSISHHGKWQVDDAPVEGSLLEVRTSINHGLMAYIVDAYQEKHGEAVLAIDPQLAPFKLAIADCSALPEKTVTEVIRYVTQELREAGVPVLNLGQIDEQEAARIYDEMGVPYTLVLPATMLDNGVLHLRSRDTTLKEEVHITLVKEKILKYTRGRTTR